MQHRRTKWVWIDGFSSGVWKWECFRTVESQQVESSRWMEQQQKKRDRPVRCVCEERRASEHRKSAEPEVVHGSVPARWDMYTLFWHSHLNIFNQHTASSTKYTWLSLSVGRKAYLYPLGWHKHPSHANAEACLKGWPNVQPQGRDYCSVAQQHQANLMVRV